MDSITFSSTVFPVVAHEDEDINPGILGRSLADWIKEKLSGTKFAITEDFNEDFGHCLMVHRKPYCLWVGCLGASSHPCEEGGLDEAVAASFPLASIEWTVFVATEMGWLSRLLGRDQRAQDQVELLEFLRAELAALPHVVFT